MGVLCTMETNLDTASLETAVAIVVCDLEREPDGVCVGWVRVWRAEGLGAKLMVRAGLG